VFGALGSSAGRLGRTVEALSSGVGARLALAQALVLVCALGVAGGVIHLSEQLIGRNVIRHNVLGETGSLVAEFYQKGAAHLPHTVEKRSRLWHGFQYRLSGPDGRWRAGALPAVSGAGWETVVDRRHGSGRSFLVFVSSLPDGSTLAVGQDLAQEARQQTTMTLVLICCGVAGAAAGFTVSIIVMGGVWRRVAEVARTARRVSTGRLDIRAPVRPGGARDEIDELGLAFNTMLNEIDDLVGQVRHVSASIAHDLRTPLTRVRQQLERLRSDTTDSSAVRDGVERIDAELEEVLRGFDAMLRLAEIENNAIPTGAELELGELAGRVAEAYRPDIEEAGRQFSTRIEPARVFGDPQLIAQLLANLLDNALRHTPRGASLELGVARRGGVATVYVADQGPGVPQELRSLVLLRFRRLDDSRNGGGCGLGLAIVAAIAKRHGAELRLLDNHPGLRVELQFPLST
jgi:signal transduction histidine kinase